MNKLLIALVVIALVGSGAWFLMNSTSTKPESSVESDEIDLEEAPLDATDSGEANVEGQKTFNVDASKFKFSVTEMRVKKGDKVKVILTNKDGLHDWVLDEFNARTSQIEVGKSVTVEFIADNTGTFEYYCSVGSHRKMGMVGKLIVE
jgi:plastocyanin